MYLSGLIHRDRYYYVLIGYDLDNYADYSPGRQHLYWLLERSFDEGLKVFDFTIGDESYKDRWCETTLNLWNSIRATSSKGAFFGRLYETTERIKREIKGNPAYWDKAVRIRKLFLKLRRQTPD